MSKEMREHIDKFKTFLLKESKNDDIENIISIIDSYTKKIKINKPYVIYNDGLETAISNSEITKFYSGYYREYNKKYVKSIPFPFEKIGDNLKRFDKLNKLCKIYEKYSDDFKLLLVKNLSLHLMDIILYDIYFDIKSRRYDVYEVVDNLSIPDENSDEECRKFAKWFTDKDNPINIILFFSNTNNIIVTIRDSY